MGGVNRSRTAVNPAHLPVLQELCFQVDGALQLKAICVSQGEGQRDDAVLARASVQV